MDPYCHAVAAAVDGAVDCDGDYVGNLHRLLDYCDYYGVSFSAAFPVAVVVPVAFYAFPSLAVVAAVDCQAFAGAFLVVQRAFVVAVEDDRAWHLVAFPSEEVEEQPNAEVVVVGAVVAVSGQPMKAVELEALTEVERD